MELVQLLSLKLFAPGSSVAPQTDLLIYVMMDGSQFFCQLDSLYLKYM